ncbi:unnamed protein product [Pleuronectes platessa]|uniref:Uncharacterized protein n=1 Tax=Pleuronectes platessa TaxID=8262 RepID=A0A9N7V908_PLEPL|nr:unnamed protein product [Pleuronectes platessa]
MAYFISSHSGTLLQIISPRSLLPPPSTFIPLSFFLHFPRASILQSPALFGLSRHVSDNRCGGLWASSSLPICPGTASFVPWLARLTGGVATLMDDSALSFSVRVLHLCFLPCGSLSKTSRQNKRRYHNSNSGRQATSSNRGRQTHSDCDSVQRESQSGDSVCRGSALFEPSDDDE